MAGDRGVELAADHAGGGFGCSDGKCDIGFVHGTNITSALKCAKF